MGRNQRQHVVNTYGRHQRRIVTVAPWSSGESGQHLFSSFSSDDSSLSGNASHHQKHSLAEKPLSKTCVKNKAKSQTSLGDCSSSIPVNGSGTVDSLSRMTEHQPQEVLRDATNTTVKSGQSAKKQKVSTVRESATAQKKTAPTQKKTTTAQKTTASAQKKTTNAQKQKASAQKKTAAAQRKNAGSQKLKESKRARNATAAQANVSTKSLGSTSAYNFSDFENYSLIMAESPAAQSDLLQKPSASVMQTSTPHLERCDSSRLQVESGMNVLELSLTAGSPIVTVSPTVAAMQAFPDVSHVDVSDSAVSDISKVLSKLDVSPMSSMACSDVSREDGARLVNSLLDDVPQTLCLRRRKKVPQMRNVTSKEFTKAVGSNSNASQSPFEGFSQHPSAVDLAREKADIARQKLKHLRELQSQSQPAHSESASSTGSDRTETSRLIEMAMMEGALEEEAGSDSAESTGAEESASEEELLGEICEEDEEETEEEYADCCSRLQSSSKSSIGSEADVTRYMMADEADDNGASDSDSCSSSDDDDDVEGVVFGKCTLEYEPEQDCESHSVLELVESSPVRHKSCSIHSESLSPMVLLTPIRLYKSGPLASDRQKVLHQCMQNEPISFYDCITPRMLQSCVKIGEGTFGEVFKAKKEGETVALKVIPIEGSQLVNDEIQKKYSGIITEIVISRQLSMLRDNPDNATESFVHVNDVSLVQGSYPEELLRQWDQFSNSENDRPDFFEPSQLFIIFEFEECGCALEKFKFQSLSEAKSIVHQVTCALAIAESALQFEHRDLHIGNMLIKRTSEPVIDYILHGSEGTIESNGVKVAIIDFTLSRLTHENISVYNNLGEDKELFQGTGDYQFDIYRMMRETNGDDWAKFTPKTNVFWLHYLTQKLLAVKYARSDQKLGREFRTFQREALDYCSALHLLKECPFFNS